MLDLKIINGNCFISGKLEKQDIGIKQGKIVKIGSLEEESKETFNAENLTILPGCIDTQVHFIEPGSNEELCAKYGLDADGILQSVKKCFF